MDQAVDGSDLSAPVTIVPPRRWPGLALEETWRMRSVCLVLASRLLKVRYRQAVIGIAWTVLQPILFMLAFTIFFGLFARTPSDGLPYPLFFFSGLVVWQITAKLLSEGSSSVLSNSTLITRIYFPRVYFPGAVALTSLVDLFFNVVALVLLMLFYGYLPLPSVVAVPAVLAVAYAFSFGLSLWFAALHVFYRDVGVLVPFLTQVGFFVSPLIYPVSVIPAEYQAIYYLNPMAVAIEGFRWAVLGGTAPPTQAWVIGSIVAVVTLLTGFVFFRQREGLFADVI